MCAAKTPPTSHPLYKDYDRLFFDNDGNLVPSTLSFCKDGTIIKLTNLSLDFDHPRGRKLMFEGDLKPPLAPCLVVYEGSGCFLDYSYTVETADSEIYSTYFLVIRDDGIKTDYYGGLNKMAKAGDGLWMPISQLEFNDYSDWVQDVMQSDAAFQYWHQRVCNTAKSRILKSAADIVYGASSQADKDIINKDVDETATKALAVLVPEIIKTPEPPPAIAESGYSVDIGKKPYNAELEAA